MILETFTSSSPDLTAGVSALSSLAAYAFMGVCGKVRVGFTSAMPYYHSSQAIDQINEIAELRDGWSGDGSLAPTERIIIAAQTIAVSILGDRPGAEIAAMPNGTIAFDWEMAKGTANLEIGATSFSFYISLADDQGFIPLSGEMRYLPLPLISHLLGSVLMPSTVGIAQGRSQSTYSSEPAFISSAGMVTDRRLQTTYSSGVERLAYA
jgi:hypothetical protein